MLFTFKSFSEYGRFMKFTTQQFMIVVFCLSLFIGSVIRGQGYLGPDGVIFFGLVSFSAAIMLAGLLLAWEERSWFTRALIAILIGFILYGLVLPGQVLGHSQWNWLIN